MASTFIPVYRDTFCEYSGDSLSFYVLADEGVVFNGKAVKGPNEQNIRINVNRIAKDYLSQSLDNQAILADNQVFEHREAFRVFHFYRNDGILLGTYGVLFDWGLPFSGATTVLSDPITPHISKDMKAVYTVYNASGVTIDVDEDPITSNTYFELLNKNIVFPYSGGTSLIRFNTDYYPTTAVSAYTTSTAYTLSNLTHSSVVVTSAQNSGSTLLTGEVVFTYAGNVMGWDTTNVVTLRNETPVTAITWDSGITVNRPCWQSVPFDDEIYFPGTLSNFKKEAARTSNATCITECPFRFEASEDWVHFYRYDGQNWTTGYKFRSWPLVFTCDDNPDQTTRTATISTYSGNTLLKTTTLIQWPSGNTKTEPVWEDDYLHYTYRFADFGPFDREIEASPSRSLTLGYVSSLDASVIYPDGSKSGFRLPITDYLSVRGTVVQSGGKYYARVWTKVPATLFSTDTSDLASTVSAITMIPKQVVSAGSIRLPNSSTTLNYEGTVEDWLKVPKGDKNGTINNGYVQCTGGKVEYSAKSAYMRNEMEVCSDCGGYLYEYPKNSGDPTSVDIIYSGASTSVTSTWKCFDEYGNLMEPVSHTYSDGLGRVTYPRPPYTLYFGGVNPCDTSSVNYLISGSLRELYGPNGPTGTALDIDTRTIETPLLEKVDLLYLSVRPLDCDPYAPALSAASMSFNNVVSGRVTTDVANNVILLPNAKYAQIGGANFETMRLFIPSAIKLYVPQQSYRITELIIGPTMEEIIISGSRLLTELTELCFNAPADVFYDWLNTGMHRYDVIEKMPNLQVVHCLDADVHSW